VPTTRPGSIRHRAAAGAVLLALAVALLVAGPRPAAAVVMPLDGYRATVLGFTSWYGSYAMAGLGTAWCIDHGIHAPDPAFAYRPADLASVPERTRTAMAWAIGRHASGTDRTRHAAVMLVLHDLMGARYPYGALDVDHLRPRDLAGFEGQEARVIELARLFKADGLWHAHLREPITLGLRIGPPDAAGAAAVTLTARDAIGQAVAGLQISLEPSAGSSLAKRSVTTTSDGTARTIARPVRLPLTVRANAIVPRLNLDAWAPTTRSAQRVARPRARPLTASASVAAPAPTTTTTAAPTTTSTTTTVPPTTTSTTTSTTLPPATTSTTPPSTPPLTVLSTPPAVPSLPRTGVDSAGLVLLATGLLLLGTAALEARRQHVGGPAAMRHHGGDGGLRPR
jgi:hypothetical protein